MCFYFNFEDPLCLELENRFLVEFDLLGTLHQVVLFARFVVVLVGNKVRELELVERNSRIQGFEYK